MKTILAAALVSSTLIVHTAGVYAAPAGDVSNRPRALSLREAARKEGARLAATSTQTAAQVANHRRNWAARHPVIIGTLAGAGVGLGFAAGSGCESSSDYTCGGVALFLAGTGAGLGAIGGLMVSLFLR